jgi:4-amino-4-deoxy-L-arabinose transferase-like glycosyltransferase
MTSSLIQSSSRTLTLLRPDVSSVHSRSFSKHIHLIALASIAASVGISLVYSWFLCPLDLASDEAHYWDWSRNLDWCYYSKGPLVAWLIRGSCELFGSFSTAVTGDLGAAVRLPAILCHGALLLGSYLLSSGIFRSSFVGLIVVAVEMSLPLVRVGSVLMTIDAPFLACWCWALLCVWKALTPNPSPWGNSPSPPNPSPWGRGEKNCSPLPQGEGLGGEGKPGRTKYKWWLGAAAFIALGILAKFTMTLLPIALISYLLVHKRSEFQRPGVLVLLGGTILGWMPILEWNARHEWVSFRHVFGQVGAERGIGARFLWFGPLVFFGSQLGMLFGGWLIAFLFAGRRFQPHRERDAGVRLLWWSSVPVWLLFAVVSLLKTGQPNWPAPAYIGGTILAVAWVREEWTSKYSRLVRWGLIGTLALSLAVTVAVHFPGTIRPVLAQLVQRPTVLKPLPIRNLDITARLEGWKTLANEVDRVRDRLRSTTGEEPVLAGTNWTIPGHLGFYCQDHPQAYSLGVVNGSDRHSQYDYWRPNPVNDAQAFLGRTFVIVGDIGPELREGFERIEPGINVVHSEDGIPIAAWTIWVCHGLRGNLESRTNGLVPGY